MNLFERLRNGWHLGMNSLEVVRDHPRLLIFPVLSGLALMSILISFGVGAAAVYGISLNLAEYSDWTRWEGFGNEDVSAIVGYLLAFGFYFISYFIVIFFNVALMHAARAVFGGGQVDIGEALRFAAARRSNILTWTALAATVGTVLQIIEDKVGFLGKIVTGLVGMVWSIMTYFVVPVLAYEDVSPVEAVRRSTALIKQKWGESIGAGFSFSLLVIAGIVGVIIGAIALFVLRLPVLAILFAFVGILLTIVVHAAAKSVFLAAAYEHVHGHTPRYYDDNALNHLFYQK